MSEWATVDVVVVRRPSFVVRCSLFVVVGEMSLLCFVLRLRGAVVVVCCRCLLSSSACGCCDAAPAAGLSAENGG